MKSLILISMLVFGMFSIELKAQNTANTKAAVSTDSNIETVKLKITGITCGGCSSHIAKVLGETTGVLEHSVEYPGNTAVIKFDKSKTDVTALVKLIATTGYKAAVIKPSDKK